MGCQRLRWRNQLVAMMPRAVAKPVPDSHGKNALISPFGPVSTVSAAVVTVGWGLIGGSVVGGRVVVEPWVVVDLAVVRVVDADGEEPVVVVVN